MDFKELMLIAQEKSTAAAKQSQQVKRLDTALRAPKLDIKKEDRPKLKSEVLQRLIEEKEREKWGKREAEEMARRKQEEEKRRLKEEHAREEKRKNTFRIPKKAPDKDSNNKQTSVSPLFDELFGESDSDDGASGHASTDNTKEKSSDQPVKRSSGDSSSDKDHRHSQKHSSSHRSSSSSDKHFSSGSSGHHSSKHESKRSKDERKSGDSSKSSHKHSHSSSEKDQKHKFSSGSSEKSKSSSSTHHSNHSNSSEKHKSSSSHHSSSSEKHRSSSNSHHRGSERHMSSNEHSEKRAFSSSSHERSHSSSEKHKSSSSGRHASGGSDDGGHSVNGDYRNKPASSSEGSPLTSLHPEQPGTAEQQESAENPVALTRHHLKPNIARTGGSNEERAKVLARLAAIREKMSASDEMRGSRKRASKEEVRARRAKRTKDMDGDFSGSCMESVPFDPEEKPSLKRPEPQPEEPKPTKQKPEKKSRTKLQKPPREKPDKDIKVKSRLDLKGLSKVDKFSAAQVKPKPKPRPPPPTLNFAELMKMAEKKQQEPVIVNVVSKKEKERRPMTQEEIDRMQARKERVKTQEYKEWYKHGEKALKSSKPEQDEDQDEPHARNRDLQRPSQTEGKVSSNKRMPSEGKPGQRQIAFSQPSSSHPVFKTQPHPTRPGAIANKPRAMAQHMNNGHKGPVAEKQGPRAGPSGAPKAGTSSEPSSGPSGSVDKGRGGNAWDSLFSKPEYQRKKPPPPKQGRVIDSEEEDEDYDEDMDDFIDDEGEEDMNSVSGTLRQLFPGYYKRKYQDYDDDDDSDMEVGFAQVMKEEARSARLGLQEDLEDIRQEQEELRRKALMKKKMKR